MREKFFGVLQRVGRSFMLPIAILPVAGLLLGLGSSFTNETTLAALSLIICPSSSPSAWPSVWPGRRKRWPPWPPQSPSW